MVVSSGSEPEDPGSSPGPAVRNKIMTKIIFAFSWGHQFPRPGLSNEVIARAIDKIKNDFDIIIVQYEIGEALKPYGFMPDYIIGQPGIYINTFEVVDAMVKWTKSKKLDLRQCDIAIICHSAHWSGCKFILKKFNISAHRLPIQIPYDLNSHQWYTRGSLRAFFGRVLHALQYLLKGQI